MMIEVLPVALGFVAGICFLAGAYHMLVGLRRRPRDRTHITFSLMILFIVVALAGEIVMRRAMSVSEMVLGLRLLGTGVALALICWAWFVSFYADFQPRRLLIALSVVCGIAAVLNLVFPFGILYSEITGIYSNTFPWGESFSMIEGTPNPWQLLNILVFLTAYGYVFYAAYRQYRRGEHRQAVALALAQSFVIAATLHDFLIDFGLITHMTALYPASHVALVVVMSLSMAEDVVQAGVARQELVENERRWRSLLENVELVVVGLNLRGNVDYVNPYFTKVTGFEQNEALNENWFDRFIPERDREEIRRLFANGINEAFPRHYQNLILAKGGGERAIAWSNVRLQDVEGCIIGSLSIGTDVTQREETEAELQQYREHLEDRVEERTAELSRAVGELQALSEIAQIVSTVGELPATLAQVAEATTLLLEARSVAINELTPDQDETRVLAEFALDDGMHPGVGAVLARHPASKLAKAVLGGETEIICGQEIDVAIGETDQVHHRARIDSIMLVPLLARGSTIGFMEIARDAKGSNFTLDESSLAQTIAGYVAAAIDNARLYAQARDLAVAEERGRLAHELHDSVTQNLYTVATISRTLPRLWDTHPDEIRPALDDMQRLTAGALAEMRTLLLELRPAALLEKHLGELLEQLAETVKGRTRIDVTTTVSGDRTFPPDAQVGLYRVAQEALNNVVKHSDASHIIIGLYCEGDRAVLRIHDDGTGFDPERVPPGRLGIVTMRERAAAIDAHLNVTSQPGAGTEVKVLWDGKGKV